MNNRLLAPVGAFTFALLLGVGAVVSHARTQGEEAGKPSNANASLVTNSLAAVDMEKVYAAAGGPEQLQAKSNEIEAEATQRLKSLSAVPYLNQMELQEYGVLVGRAMPSDVEQARMKALRDLSDQRQQELNGLQVKPDAQLTEMDKTRMRQLQEASRLLERILPAFQDDLRQQQLVRVDAYRREQMTKLRSVVAQVAKEKGVSHVFDASSLVYSVNDLTAAVVQKIGKRASK